MAEKKITKKELFAHIAEVMSNDEEVVAMCEKYIAQLGRKAQPKMKPEVEEFRRVVLNILEDQEEPVTNKRMRELWLEKFEEEISAQKMAGALRWLVANGYAKQYAGEGKNNPNTFVAEDFDMAA